MHIPDGFLDAKTIGATAALAGAGIGCALRRASRTLPPRQMPLMGLAAAFVFAAQMLNFPVLGGTSGHLLGGVLAAVLLGPGAAVVVMTAVLIVQALLFNDGGLLALGANLFNMALVAPVAGYAVYRLLRKGCSGPAGVIMAAAFAGWCSTVLAAISCAGQLAFSGTADWRVVFPAMANIHLLIGIGEGLITGLIVAAILRVRPELVETSSHNPGNRAYAEFLLYGLLVTAGLVIFVAPQASSWPDGLERVAAWLGFDHQARPVSLMPAPLADYAMPGVHSAAGATLLAGLIGTAVAFALAWLLARLLAPATPSRNADPPIR